MIQQILVPLDGSTLAEAALPAAAAMAKALGARVNLLHVIEESAPDTIHGERHLTDADQAEAYLEEVGQWPVFKDLPLEIHVHRSKEGNVAESVVDHAQEFGADLVVLSTHGSGGLRDLLFGSIAQQALQRGTTPILFVKPPAVGGAAPFTCRQVFIPLDGSTAHEDAVPFATTLARVWKAAIHLEIVVPTVDALSGHHAATRVLMPMATRHVLDLAERGAEEYVERLAGKLAADGIPTTCHVSRGDPTICLVEAARAIGADLVAMATHARGMMDSFWSQSLTPKLMQGLGCPILLIRAEGAEATR